MSSKARFLTAAQTADHLAQLGLDQARARTFAYEDELPGAAYTWHTHARHQLLCPVTGTARLDVAEASFLLPPQRAALIPAGERHATARRDASIVSIYFDPSTFPSPLPAVRIFEVPALLREMVLHARRWTVARGPDDVAANTFFSAMADVVGPLLDRGATYRLPRGRTPPVQRAIACALQDVSSAELSRAAAFAGSTERTLRRRFREETGMTWRAFVTRARVLRALDLLSSPDASVTQVALDVGFQSLGAFAAAFRAVTGQTPSAFRRAALPGQAVDA
ncbi:AraC family transcriptional regulator [Sorangium cellulosum]|uniref:AraC family transcriptional regulator n=1 Tax=Sorangium cellulosum TaxID=56 RepID=A0A2L0F3N5_SORCE|nr:helix-turn-helix transcriptional regulator [Sorangium cellulosum]AUX46156.1 AraC family transcriptional regulator [Sorangium cellulosum]